MEIEMLHSVTGGRSSGTAPAATFFSMAVVSTCCTQLHLFVIAWEMVRNQSRASLFPADVRSSAPLVRLSTAPLERTIHLTSRICPRMTSKHTMPSTPPIYAPPSSTLVHRNVSPRPSETPMHPSGQFQRRSPAKLNFGPLAYMWQSNLWHHNSLSWLRNSIPYVTDLSKQHRI